jgi:transporter family-2 protein
MGNSSSNGMIMAILVGSILPLQALINARLGQVTQGPLFASTVSFLVGTLALCMALGVFRVALPSMQVISNVPLWAWLGGVLGAVYVLTATLLIPRLGAAALICLVVLGQIIGSLMLDHFGVLHSPKPIDAMRLLGGALVVVGAALVVQPWHN